MKGLAERLKFIRLNSKMTQQEVADKINTSRSNISKYENGLLEPNIDTLVQLIELYKISADYLLGIKKDK